MERAGQVNMKGAQPLVFFKIGRNMVFLGHKKLATKVTLENHDPAKIKKKKLKVAPSLPLSSLLDPHSLIHVFYKFLFEWSAPGLLLYFTQR